MPLTPAEIDRLVGAWLERQADAPERLATFEKAQASFRDAIGRLREAQALGQGGPPDHERVLSELMAAVGSTGTSDPTFWAEEQLRSVMFEGTEDSWRVLCELVRLAPNDDCLQTIGAGPLEDFLVDEVAERFGGRIEELAAVSRNFRVALATAWGLPASIRDISARHPPGPDPAHPVNVSADLLDRFERYAQAVISGADEDAALSAARITAQEVQTLYRLVAEVVRVVRAPEAFAQAQARFAQVPALRRQHLDQLKALWPPGAATGFLPDLDDPEVNARFLERDAAIRDRILGELAPAGGHEERVAAIRKAWGSEAVDLLLAHLGTLEELLRGIAARKREEASRQSR